MTATTATAPVVRSGTRLAAATALVLGFGVVFLVGFSPVNAMHNAAHDTRHSMSFPCH